MIKALIELENIKSEFSGGKTNHLSFGCGRLFCLLALSLHKVQIVSRHFIISYDPGDYFTISYDP